MPTDFYICPRCDHETNQRNDMRRHFNRKNKCHDKNNLELTDEIKQTVLDNHRYHPPKKEKETVSNTINQTVNNYNTLNNFIGQMDTCEKISYLLGYENKQLQDLEDSLDKRFEKRIERLNNNSFKVPYQLTSSDFLKIINDVTKIDKRQIECFNIIFDKKINRIKMYRDKQWEPFLLNIGIGELISLIKSYFLDTYENYLVRNIHGTNLNIVYRNSLSNHLNEYYRFISIFDLPPGILGLTDKEILGYDLKENNPNYLEEYCYKIYTDIKNELKIAEKTAIKKQISNIIKENTIQNVDELNKNIFSIMQYDTVFKNKLIAYNTHTTSENKQNAVGDAIT